MTLIPSSQDLALAGRVEDGGMKKFWAAGILAVLILGGCEKARLDDEVRRLCAIDGGIKVYEAVKLPSEKFDKFGVVLVPSKDKARLEDEYFYEWDIHYFKRGNPEMWRDHFRIIRRRDAKVLGEAIGYSRRGGDLIGPWHDSSFGCPDNADISILKKRVFSRVDRGGIK